MLAGVYNAHAQGIDTSSRASNNVYINGQDSPRQLNVKSSLDKMIDYHCTDSIFYDFKNGLIYLYGNAEIKYGDINLKAGLIVIDVKKQELFAKSLVDSNGKIKGRPVLTDNGDEYKGDSMRYNSKSKRGRVYGLRLQEGESYVQMEKVYKEEDGSFTGNRGKVTTCNDPHPHFYLLTRKIKVIPNKKVIFGPSNLVIEDVPTPAFLPFGLVPTTKSRKSGLIIPGTAFSSARGYGLNGIGYYLGINEYMDLTLTGDLFLNGSWAARGTTRYSKRYKFGGNFSGAYSKYFTEDPVTLVKAAAPQLSLTWNHSVDPKAAKNLNFSANVNFQTGGYNQFNSTNFNNIVKNSYQSNVNLGKSFLNQKVNLNGVLSSRQNVADSSIYFNLPNINLSVQRITPFVGKDGINSGSLLENINLSYQSTMINDLKTSESRLFAKDGLINELKRTNTVMKHSIPVSTNFKFWKKYVNVSPGVSYDEWWYFSSVNKYFTFQDTSTRTDTTKGFKRAWQYNTFVNLNTNLYGTFYFRKLGKIKGLRHTIQPNIGLSYVPQSNIYYGSVLTDSGRSLSRYSIFENTQGILGAPSTQRKNAYLNFSLANIFQLKVKSKDTANPYKYVSPLDRLNLGGSYNLTADSFQLSAISLSSGMNILNRFNMSLSGSFDPYKVISVNGRERRVNEYVANGFSFNDRQLARFTNAQLYFSTSLSANDFKKGKDKKSGSAVSNDNNESEQLEMLKYPGNFYRYDIPWSIRFNYNLSYNRSNFKNTFSNQVNISGDINLSPEWKVIYSTGYDFNRKEISASSFGFERNLHCWALSFNWIPNGVVPSWNFTLRPKSGMLQDMKINKKSFWWDL